MKLPLSLIQNAVEDLVDWEPCQDADGERSYGRPMFWRDGMDGQEGDLFLVMRMEGGLDRERLMSMTSVLLIFDGDIPERRGEWVCVGKLKPHVSMIDVADRLHGSFNQYEEWESLLRSRVFGQNALREMVCCSRGIIDNPIMVMNAGFQIIAMSDPMRYMWEHGYSELDQEGYIPDEAVNVFKNDAAYQGAAWEKGPFYYHNDGVLPGRVLCQNLFYQGTFAARVVVCSIEHDLNEWDPFLLDILTSYLQLVYLDGSEQRDGGTARIFSDLLHGIPTGREELLEFVSFKNWGLGDHYKICVLLPGVSDLSDHTLGYFCHCLTMGFKDCLAIHEEGRIIVIGYLGEEGDPDDLDQKLLVFAREADLRIGMSDHFCGLDAVPMYYREAVIALSYGMERDPDLWCHAFQRHALDYILDKCCEGLPAYFLCAHEIRVLERYDAVNHTDLNLTLKTYLKNDQSAVRTAKELYIQRGTLRYRIDRIQKLTGIHFKDREKLLYLSISYAMEAKRVLRGRTDPTTP